MILVLVETDGPVLLPTSQEALTFGRRLADALEVPLHAVAVGVGVPAVDAIGAFGVRTLHLAEVAGPYAPAAWARAVASTADSIGPAAVLASGTDRGNEVLAHVGAQTGAPMVANCVEATLDGDALAITRLRWGGSLLEHARVRGPLRLLTIAPHVTSPVPASAAMQPEVVTVVPTFAPEDLIVRVASVEEVAPGTVSLGDARVVVGGGRGVGGAEGFGILDDLAALLGGAVGVSRAVTSAGWRPHAEQVGQTGARIAPEIYLACGISGASQHMVGCRGAKRILAVNTDPDAPILAKADYAVIGDLRSVVPAIAEEIRRRGGG
jgi:electron transfer flavoprotein alpha subunit